MSKTDYSHQSVTKKEQMNIKFHVQLAQTFSPRKQTFHADCSNGKMKLEVFFDSQSI